MNKSFRVKIGSGKKALVLWTYAADAEEIAKAIASNRTTYSQRQVEGKPTAPRKAKKAAKPVDVEGQVTEASGKAESTQ